MKKHFLLLLMAFMSISAWAEDIAKCSIVAPSNYYGLAPSAVEVTNASGVKLTQDIDYTLDGYFSDVECKKAVTTDQIKAADAGTRFYVKITGINKYENSTMATFQVKQMPLTVSVSAKSKEYLADEPTAAEFAALKTGVTLSTGADAPTAVAAAVTVTGRDAGENVGSYKYTATLTEQPNYIIGGFDDVFVITTREFSETNVAITVTAEFTYNGKAQDAAIEVKDTKSKAILVKSTDGGVTGDYTVTYKKNTAAGINTAEAYITGINNYSGTTIKKNYSIADATLLVTPMATRVYDGTNTAPTLPADVDAFGDAGKFVFQGFVETTHSDPTWTTTDDGDGKKTSWTVTIPTGTTGANVGTYKLNINSDNNIKLTNYVAEPVEGEFEITARELKVSATAELHQVYGAPENFTYTITAGAVTYDTQSLTYALKVVNTGETDDDGDYKLSPTWRTDAEIDAAVAADDANVTKGCSTDAEKIAARNKAKADAKQARLNYSITATTAKLKYDKAPLKIALKESAYTLTKVYDGQPVPEITIDKVNGLSIIGLVEGDVVNLDNLELKVADNAATANTYTLNLSGATAENYAITYIPSQYEITKRPLNMTIGDQTFVKGTALNLDQTLYTLPTGDNEGLASTDQASDVFELATDVVASGTPKVITSAAGSGYSIYANLLTATGKKGNNYTLIGTTDGVATVVAAASTDVTLDTSKKIATTASKTATNVIIESDRVLNPENWNAMVLPFEVSVAQISETFGYAIVNRLNTTATTEEHVAFSLEMKKVPANEPFLVKIVGKETGSEYKPLSLNGITFTDVKVVKSEEKAVEAGGNKFTGVYEDKELLGSIYGFIYDDPTGVRENKWYTPRTTAYTIHPLDAYLTYATAKAPKITVEDIDGTVTAIQAVKDGSFREVNAEGWYTIGGMKLQGAPTQKGVYINNGKKVIVK